MRSERKGSTPGRSWYRHVPGGENAYTGFAAVYDAFMQEIPYEKWGERLVELLDMYGIGKGLVLDLGCGTGNMTEWLAGQGYDMIGVDASGEMLERANAKRILSGQEILYLQQDMTEFELYGTVRAVISVCDSINYITEPAELCKVFRLVNLYLDPGGLFIFDFNTERKYQEIGDQTIAEVREEGAFVWENAYYEAEKINEYGLTVFVRDEALSKREQACICRQSQEVHCQRAYHLAEIQDLLSKAGLQFVAAFDGYSKELPRDSSQRICVVAKEQGK